MPCAESKLQIPRCQCTMVDAARIELAYQILKTGEKFELTRSFLLICLQFIFIII